MQGGQTSIGPVPSGSTCTKLGAGRNCNLATETAKCGKGQILQSGKVVCEQPPKSGGSDWANGPAVLQATVEAVYSCEPKDCIVPIWPTINVPPRSGCAVFGDLYPCGKGATGSIVQNSQQVCSMQAGQTAWTNMPVELQAGPDATYSCSFTVPKGSCSSIGQMTLVAPCPYGQTGVLSTDSAGQKVTCQQDAVTFKWANGPEALLAEDTNYFYCKGTVTQPGPADTTKVHSVFQMPTGPTGTCVPAQDTFEACPAYTKSDNVILFGGSSDWEEGGNKQTCEKGSGAFFLHGCAKISIFLLF